MNIINFINNLCPKYICIYICEKYSRRISIQCVGVYQRALFNNSFFFKKDISHTDDQNYNNLLWSVMQCKN